MQNLVTVKAKLPVLDPISGVIGSCLAQPMDGLVNLLQHGHRVTAHKVRFLVLLVACIKKPKK